MPALTRIAGHFAHHLYFSDQTKAGLKRSKAQTGAITLIQRFGSAANRNIHPHCLGTPDTQQGRAEPAPAKAGVLTLKTPYRDGTTHIVLSPLEFMQRLAALVPRPRLNLIRFASFCFAKYLLTPFHGVLAPNAKLRAEIIPGSKKNKSHASNASDAAPSSSVSVRINWARLLKRVFEIEIEH